MSVLCTAHLSQCARAGILSAAAGDTAITDPASANKGIWSQVPLVSRSPRGSHLINEQRSISPTSSRGPAHDGRFKPDVYAPGYYVDTASLSGYIRVRIKGIFFFHGNVSCSSFRRLTAVLQLQCGCDLRLLGRCRLRWRRSRARPPVLPRRLPRTMMRFRRMNNKRNSRGSDSRKARNDSIYLYLSLNFFAQVNGWPSNDNRFRPSAALVKAVLLNR